MNKRGDEKMSESARSECGCGKEVKTMSAKGMSVCADGCPEIADKPGKCACECAWNMKKKTETC